MRHPCHLFLLLSSALLIPWAACSDNALTPVPDAGVDDPDADDGEDASKDRDAAKPKDAAVDVVLPADCTAASTHIRAVAANLSSGTKQNWDGGEGARILKGLVPDVVMMQEFNFGNNQPATIAKFVSDTVGATYTYVRGTGDIPNGILSRYPIVKSGNWTDALVSNRAFTWARIDLPGSHDLLVVSVHLLTSGDRGAEAAAVVTAFDDEILPNEFGLVGGDFNTKLRTESALVSFSAGFVVAAPFPLGPALDGGPENTNEPRTSPYDWVIATKELDDHEVPVKLGVASASYAGGLVFDSQAYMPLSEVAGVQTGDSHSLGMQHMAVVRDFEVPCE